MRTVWLVAWKRVRVRRRSYRRIVIPAAHKGNQSQDIEFTDIEVIR